MKNSKISSPRKIVLRFAMIFIPLWKSLAMNITPIGGACSLIHQQWAWRWFYSTTEIHSPPFLRLMQSTRRNVMKARIYFWERLSMTNLSGSYVVILSCGTVIGMQLGYTKYCCFRCHWDGRDKKNHNVNKLWPKRTSLTPGEKNVVIPLLLPENIYLPPLHIQGVPGGMCQTSGGCSLC